MASVRLAPKTTFAFENNSSKSRDDSLSTYLTMVKENLLAPELGDCTPDQFSCQISLNRRRTFDREIEIFDAEKYFSGVMDAAGGATPEQMLGTPISKEVHVLVQSKSRPGSVSSISEASSCNSRSTLLHDHHRKHLPASYQRDAGSSGGGGKRFLGVFPCSSCARKNALDVIDKEAMPDLKMQQNDEHLVCDSRFKRSNPSLKQEVFGFPPNLNSGTGKSVSVRKDFKLEEEKEGFVFTLRRSVGGRDDDVRSDASSDLFEIECLSINSHPLAAGSESVTTTGYEPSEASVEWSVATASVANFSIASDTDEQATSFRKTRRSSGSGLLLGCVSNKAVSVTASASARMYERNSFDRLGLEGGAEAPTARFRVESCGVDLGSGRAAPDGSTLRVPSVRAGRSMTSFHQLI